MKSGKIIALTAVVVLALSAGWGAGPAFGGEKVQIALNRSQGVDKGSGEAVFADSRLTITVKDLKPNSVYTVWYVNTEPKHEQAGVGQTPYMFKTNQKGAATFKATLGEQPFGKWQMLVIVRHPNGDPRDMQHMEDALWAHLKKADGKAANPCAMNPCAVNPCAPKGKPYKGGY